MDDYVAEAERVIKEIKNEGKEITTSQIRKFLSGVVKIQNKIQLTTDSGSKLDRDLKNEILALKVKLAYQSGRDNKVKNFVQKTQLIEKVGKVIKEEMSYDDFYAYVEALVAYHKFLGGR